MEPKRSLNVTLRISNIPDNNITAIKSLAQAFGNDVRTILNTVEDDDNVYYDFNISDAEWIDQEFYDGEYRSRRRNGRRIG